MDDFCQGVEAGRGVALTGVDAAMAKPLLLIVGTGGHGRSVAEAAFSKVVLATTVPLWITTIKCGSFVIWA